MPTWSEILTEIRLEQAKGVYDPFDKVRRKYLARLSKHTGRNTILYATSFTQPKPVQEVLLSITDEDVQGMMEVVHNQPKVATDVILHSPGGSPEAAEGIVEYLHAQYPHIRVIIPQIAMSAATMIACSGHEIVMGKHSNIGPIDPQIIITGPAGKTANPAQAIIDQFDMALKEIRTPGGEGWAPLLQQYGPALIVQCKNYIKMAEILVSEWLKRWMFETHDDAKEKSSRVASFLSNHNYFKSHGRHISRQKAKDEGLLIADLEEDKNLQDLVLSVFHATTHTFQGTAAVKIIENNKGKAFIRVTQ